MMASPAFTKAAPAPGSPMTSMSMSHRRRHGVAVSNSSLSAPGALSNRGSVHATGTQALRRKAVAAMPARKAGALRVVANSSQNGNDDDAIGEFPDLKIVCFSARPYVKENFAPVVSKHFPSTTYYDVALTKDTVNLCQGADVVILFVNDDAPAEIIAEMADYGVKHIAMRCAGFDRVNTAAASMAGITISRVPSYSPVSIAEHAVALLMTLNRKLHRVSNRIREGNYSLSGLQGMEISGKTVGVIGTGRIGQGFCKIMKLGFNCRVLAYDMYPNPDMKDIGVEYVEDIQDMLPQCKIVALFCPLNDSTFHIMNKENINAMQKGAFLINCSRGGLVDTIALIEALRSGHVGAAGLDVYENEGSLFFEDFSSSGSFNYKTWDGLFTELEALPNVLVSPHSAFLTYEALQNIADSVVMNLSEFAEGKPLTNEVKGTPQVVSSISDPSGALDK